MNEIKCLVWLWHCAFSCRRFCIRHNTLNSICFWRKWRKFLWQTFIAIRGVNYFSFEMLIYLKLYDLCIAHVRFSPLHGIGAFELDVSVLVGLNDWCIGHLVENVQIMALVSFIAEAMGVQQFQLNCYNDTFTHNILTQYTNEPKIIKFWMSFAT